MFYQTGEKHDSTNTLPMSILWKNIYHSG